jgi:hypothetical protein
MKALQELLVRSNSTDDLTDLQQVAREFQQLGGDKTLRELLAFCSADKQKIEDFEGGVRSANDDQSRGLAEEDLLRAKVERLRTWRLFTGAGGISEFARLGGVQTATARDAYTELTSLKAQARAGTDIDQISDEDVAKRQANLIDIAVKQIQSDIDKFRAPRTKKAYQQRLDDLLELRRKGDPTAAQGGMKRLNVETTNSLGTETVALRLHRDEVKVLKDLIVKAAPNLVPPDLIRGVDALDKLTDPEVLDDQNLSADRRVLSAKIEHATQGANSKVGKLDQRIKAAGQTLASYRNQPFHRALADRHAELGRTLATFDIGASLENDVQALERACDFAKRTEAARGELAKMKGHANESTLQLRLGEIDQLLQALAAQDFNATIAKINEPLQAAERLVRLAKQQ